MDVEFKDACYSGDVSVVQRIIKENPNFDVNQAITRFGTTALHIACHHNHHKIVSTLLSHPDIDVNPVNSFGFTPFLNACQKKSVETLKVLLRDFRVEIDGGNVDIALIPVFMLCRWQDLETMKLLIASGKELNIDKKEISFGEEVSVIEIAREMHESVVVSLLERFIRNQSQTRHEIRVELGVTDALAAELFATTVFLCDDYLRIIKSNERSQSDRFFRIVSRLPMELQMIICCRVYGSVKDNILSKDSEVVFQFLAKKFVTEQ